MKLSTREDIEAPIGYVFQRVSDFERFERRAMRRGADVSRRAEGVAGIGMIWDVAFEFRGRPRKMQVELIGFEPQHAIELQSRSDGLAAITFVETIALSATRTRVLVSCDMRARTLNARLMLQSLKLAKAKLNKGFRGRVLDYAETIEDDYRRGH